MTTSLLLDIGNSALKLAYLEKGDLRGVARHPHGKYQLETLLDECFAEQSFGQLGLASVYETSVTQQIIQWCAQRGVDFTQARTQASSDGLVNAYPEPAQLGVDRWLGMTALWKRQRRAFCLVSCGTAVTIDVVDYQGCHLGGMILPSPGLMMQALSTFTSGLQPDHGMVATSSLLADNTDEAINRGSWGAVKALIEQVRNENDLNADEVFLTGGCAAPLAALLDNGVVLQADLLLTGLADYMNKVAS